MDRRQLRRLRKANENVASSSSSAVAMDVSSETSAGLSVCSNRADIKGEEFPLVEEDDSIETEIDYSALYTADDVCIMSPVSCSVKSPALSLSSANFAGSGYNSPVDGASSEDEEVNDTALHSSRQESMISAPTNSIFAAKSNSIKKSYKKTQPSNTKRSKKSDVVPESVGLNYFCNLDMPSLPQYTKHVKSSAIPLTQQNVNIASVSSLASNINSLRHHHPPNPVTVRQLSQCDNQPVTLQHMTTFITEMKGMFNDLALSVENSLHKFDQRLKDIEADHQKNKEILDMKIQLLKYKLKAKNAAAKNSSACNLSAASTCDLSAASACNLSAASTCNLSAASICNLPATSTTSQDIFKGHELNDQKKMENFVQRLPIRTSKEMAAMDNFLEMNQTAFLQHVITVTDKNIEDDYERLKLVYNRLFDSRSLFKEYTYAGKGEKLPLIGHRTIIEINKLLRAVAKDPAVFTRLEGKMIGKWLGNVRDQDKRKRNVLTEVPTKKKDQVRCTDDFSSDINNSVSDVTNSFAEDRKVSKRKQTNAGSNGIAEDGEKASNQKSSYSKRARNTA